jgi:hypothetical protein
MAKPPAKKTVTPQEAKRIYESARQSVVDRVKDPEKRKRALTRFDSDPRIQTIRGLAGMPFVTTKFQEIRGQAKKPKWQQETEEIARLAGQADVAKRRARAVKEAPRRVIEKARKEESIIPLTVRDKGAALIGSANDALFGLPARAAAGILDVDNDVMQEFADQQGQRAPVTNFLGTLAASIPTGGAMLKGGAALGSRLAASGSRPIAATGRAIQKGQGAATLKRGQNVRNAGRLAAGGAAVGAATEAGKGRDAAEGALFGAGGSVALGAGFKAGSLLAGKASDVFRTTGANAFIRRYTTTTREALQQRADDFRRRTGTEPTFFELLSTRDRQALSKQFGRLDEGELERGTGLARERVAAAPGEVAQVVRNATRGQRRQNVRNLATAQAEARGAATPTTAEARLAVGAADNPTRLAQIRRDEGAAIMRPFDDEQAAENVGSLIPTEMRALDPNKPGEISEVEIDPEMSAMIRSAAGLARIRPEGEGLTVRELTSMIRELKSIASDSRDAIQRGNAQRAVDHLEGVLTENVPGVETALARMNENWAARSRQLEGMRETRMQADVDPSTSQRLRKSENVFETPEGGVGRASAQRVDLIDGLQRRPDVALGTVRNLADDQTMQRQVAQNIGRPATTQISEAAQAQSEGVQNLASAIRDPDFDLSSVTSGDLATVFAGFTPGSMVQTKGRAIATLWEKFGESISRNRSRTIVDMLFSRDPAMTQRAIEALKGQGRQGVDALKDIVSMVGGAQAGNTAAFESSDSAPMPEATEAPEAETDLTQLSDEELLQMYEGEETDLTQLSDEELLQMYGEGEAAQESSPYAADVDALYASEDPALIDLIERVSKQESGGRQFDRSGNPVTSKAGAIGVMQVMPTTGPEAAKLAGVPWDRNAYRNDEAYNKLIGTAYLSEMLRRYDGDVELALVAYNAGPKRADAYAKGQVKFTSLPAETQEYVRRIM